MIFKKPYAFLIRHFKLIHLIMVFLLGYLILKTNYIINFLNVYMEAKKIVIGNSLVDPLFSVYIYVAIAIFFFLSSVILILMISKRKNFLFYLLNVVLAIILFYFFTLAQNTIGTMEREVVTLKTIRLVRDFLTIGILLGTTSFLGCFNRTIGFNFKSLSFKNDSDDLQVESSDSEEFELDLSIDSNDFRRKMNRRLRNFKYTYAEHKFMFNITILLVVLISSLLIPYFTGRFEHTYKENELYTTSDYIMGITGSYVTDRDYEGKMIDNGSQFVVLKLSIKKRFDYKSTFRSSSAFLIGSKNYHATTEYSDSFIDLGNVYDDQELSKETTEYLLVYELPNNEDVDNLIFEYNDSSNEKEYQTKLTPKSLDSIMANKDYKLGQTIEIAENIKADLKIDSYEISNRYKLDYKFCIENDKCYDSVEYLYPTLSGRDNNVLIKLEGSIEIDKTVKNIKNLTDFITEFGSIDYEKEKKRYSENEFEVVTPNNANSKDYYLSVDKDIKKADKIYLSFKFRDNNYRYILK